MKDMITPAEAHKQYSEAITTFCHWLPQGPLRRLVQQQADPYFRQCVLGVWREDQPTTITQRHIAFYNGIYARGNASPDALYWEVATGVAGYAGFQPPAFFAQLLQYDRQHQTTFAPRFVDQVTLLLLLFAAVEGQVSEGAAGFINACSDQLMALCPPSESSPLQARDFITHPSAPPQATPSLSLEALLGQLDGLCGLTQVKEDVKRLINLVKVQRLREQAGLPVAPMSLHLVFLGNPGTGKTTVARLLAQIYQAIGVLPKGHLVEVDRSGLVAGFVGQTAIKTQQVIQKALGGVLFIDEAYALVTEGQSNDFGHEAIEVLLKHMEDHRSQLVVIVAGYSRPMQAFLQANPGLQSRFNKYIYFEDYDGDQLFSIFQSMCQTHGYCLSSEGETQLRHTLCQAYQQRDEYFGNARQVRNLFEEAIARQSNRVAQLASPTKEELMELLPQDLEEVPLQAQKEEAL